MTPWPGCVAIVLLLLFTPLQARQTTQTNTIETGVIARAPYYIEIPAKWNKGLVLHAHGYTPEGSEPPPHDSAVYKAIREVFLSRGFAFAASSYSRQGWAVKEGIEETESLRRHFVATHGQPSETYITGHSMGGHITMAIIEQHADAYQGALPLCGPLGAAIDFLTAGPFDMLVTFEAIFPVTIGSPYQVRAGTGDRIKAAVAAHPDRAARFAGHYNRTVPQLTEALTEFHTLVSELKHRAGGEPFDNRNRIYAGFGDDAALNRTVRRFAAESRARDWLTRYATPTGRLSDPMLTIQTTSDALFPETDVTAYDFAAALAGSSDLFVARFVEAEGHCNFTPGQIGNAFDALLAWARDGKRPAPGEQK